MGSWNDEPAGKAAAEGKEKGVKGLPMQLGIEMAAEMLLSTDRSVTQVAMECGYNSISNFNRSFKAITGQSPVAYRKMSRAQADDST